LMPSVLLVLCTRVLMMQEITLLTDRIDLCNTK
jgi:hypothetical protein